MKLTKFVPLLALILAFVACSAVPCLSAGVKFKTSGEFVDSSGGQHAWSINDSHTLIWDSEPYIPVGGAFCSRYISLGATDDNYKADVRALEAIKSKGITDVILKATKPITATDPAAWQKMIDYLQANGFTYGIEMDDGPKEPLSGYVIAPNLYRLEGPGTDSNIPCDWPGVDSAIFVVVRTFDNSIQTQGGAILKNGKLTVSLPKPLAASEILIVYPRKKLTRAEEGGTGDLWTGFGEYRDRVLAFFKGMKFGPGFRFFLEPFTSKMDFTGEMVGFLPDSSGFRLGFEAFLGKRYTHEGSVNSAWGLLENLTSIEIAARLVPMWSQGRGVSYEYDRASAKMYPVDASAAQAWRDIVDYRDSSAQQFMNTIGDALKKNVANVPVIFKSGAYHRVYANPFGIGGFDGIGAAAYGTGEAPVSSSAGPAYSLAEESSKTTWYLVAATQTAAEKKTLVGYTTEASMATALDYFREVGCKGFFVDSLQALPDDTRGNFSLLNAPEQLDWLKHFKDKVNKASWLEFKPSVVYYPTTPVTGAYVKRLSLNTWWLPTLRTGKTTFVGDGISAYGITGEDRSVMWSNTGQRTVTLRGSNPKALPSVDFPAGSSIAKKGGAMFSVTLTDSPTVLRGLDFSLAFPMETAELQIDRLSKLIPVADKQALDVRKARDAVESARTVIKNGLAMTAYGIVDSAMQELLKAMGADIWMEGEESNANNFTNVLPAPGASGGLALVLDTTADPPLAQYSAAFKVNADSNSSYEIWLAGTPPSEGSPMSYSVDDVALTQVSAADGSVQNYAAGLAWYKIGTTNLFPGFHTIKFKVDGKRSQDNRYYFAIDAIVLSPKGFKPNGVIKPF